MKNIERYREEILKTVTSGQNIAVDKTNGCVGGCEEIGCDKCAFLDTISCVEERKEWMNAEQIKITKDEKSFLAHLDKNYNYIGRNSSGPFVSVDVGNREHGVFKYVDYKFSDLKENVWYGIEYLLENAAVVEGEQKSTAKVGRRKEETMKNKEKYQKEIAEIACTGHGFGVHINGMPYACEDIPCGECEFFEGSCDENRVQWAEAEAAPELAEQEKKALRILDPKWKYIARDKLGELYIYNSKPEREDIYWDNRETLMPIGGLFAGCDFAAIKWEDEEPWEIAKLIAD